MVSILYICRVAIIYLDPTHFILPFELNLIIGLPIFIFGMLIILFALIKMKLYSLSGTTEGEPLNKDGIYGKIRHPIYLGEIIWPVGLVIIMGKIYSIFIVIILIFYFIIYIRLEERALIQIHGESYKEYQKQVPMINPLRIRRKKRLGDKNSNR